MPFLTYPNERSVRAMDGPLVCPNLSSESDAVICQESILDLLSVIEDALNSTCPWKSLSMRRPSSYL